MEAQARRRRRRRRKKEETHGGDSLAAYAAALAALDIGAVQEDLKVFVTSQPSWPPTTEITRLFVRLAWHCAGSYRISDGRGGCDGGGSVSSPSSRGRTTPTSTRRAACCG